MRILIVGPQWVGQWTESVFHAFSERGHTAQVFYYTSPHVEKISLGLKRRVERFNLQLANWLTDYGKRWEQTMNVRLIATARAMRPELILVLKGEKLKPETLAALRQTTRHLATWWLDDPLTSLLSQETIQLYDAVFIFDRSHFASLAQAGASQVFFLPCACDAQVFRPMRLAATDQTRYRCDVAFVAVYYPVRGRVVQHLAGLDVAIWGAHWDDSDAQRILKCLGSNTWRSKFADHSTAVRIYNAATICLNVHHTQTHWGGLNMRTFEVAACGGFLLTDRVVGMEELFVPGEEIAYYESLDQVRSQVDYYLAHPAERGQIAQRGRERILRQHTYAHRIETIIQSLHLPNE